MRHTLPLLLALFLTPWLAACGDDPGAVPAPAGAPQLTEVPDGPATGVELKFKAIDRSGEDPSEAARTHLSKTLAGLLGGLGHAGADVTFPEPGILSVRLRTDDETVIPGITFAVLRTVPFQLRIGVDKDIAEKEAERRRTMAELYTLPPGVAWVPFGERERGEILVYIPEGVVAPQIEKLANDENRDQEEYDRLLERLRLTIEREIFTAGDMAGARVAGSAEHPTVEIMVRPDRVEAFRRFTEHYVDSPLVMIFGQIALAAPDIVQPLGDRFVIDAPGLLTQERAAEVALAIRRGAYGIELEPLAD